MDTRNLVKTYKRQELCIKNVIYHILKTQVKVGNNYNEATITIILIYSLFNANLQNREVNMMSFDLSASDQESTSLF